MIDRLVGIDGNLKDAIKAWLGHNARVYVSDEFAELIIDKANSAIRKGTFGMNFIYQIEKEAKDLSDKFDKSTWDRLTKQPKVVLKASKARKKKGLTLTIGEKEYVFSTSKEAVLFYAAHFGVHFDTAKASIYRSLNSGLKTRLGAMVKINQ